MFTIQPTKCLPFFLVSAFIRHAFGEVTDAGLHNPYILRLVPVSVLLDLYGRGATGVCTGLA